ALIVTTTTDQEARLPHPTSQFRYQTLPSAMRASLTEGYFVLSSPYHSSGPTPSTGNPCVERMWGSAKWRNKVQRGNSSGKYHLHTFLAEYMWRSAVAETRGNRFDALLADTVAFWDDTNTQQPITNELKKEDSDKDALNFNILGDSVACIESTSQFLQWYSGLEKEWVEDEDLVYTNYCKQLAERKEECSQLLTQVESSLNHLNELNKEYRQVTNRTNSLHQVSEQLLADQMKLSDINNAVSERLHQFKVLQLITRRLESPALSVNSSTFTQLLDQLDEA
ncbi:Golgi transport complex subunit 3, partial [Homalodisca vitripennis]